MFRHVPGCSMFRVLSTAPKLSVVLSLGEPESYVIGLITVSDVILTGRQSGQKLQCLYGNPMAKNFFQNRILRNL